MVCRNLGSARTVPSGRWKAGYPGGPPRNDRPVGAVGRSTFTSPAPGAPTSSTSRYRRMWAARLRLLDHYGVALNLGGGLDTAKAC